MTNNEATDYDIVIAGGGMIGTCLALALAPLRLHVAVVEPVVADASSQPSFDDRSTALSRSTQRMFEAMQLWPQIKEAATAIRHIHVSDKGRFGFSHIDASEQQVEALGYVVINRTLGQVLHAATGKESSIDWLAPARITSVRPAAGSRIVTIESAEGSRQLSCRLLVAADGAKSSVRDMLGISASQRAYDQLAVVGNLQPEKEIDGVAYERFTSSGPLALLPIRDNRAAFVWTLQTDAAEAAIQLSDADFTERLQSEFGQRLGRFTKIGKRAAYPLVLSRANGLTADRAVLVGNAAHGLHPVAAQGYNLGMRDVAALCDCLYDAQQASEGDNHYFDPGSAVMLETYAEWRRADQQKLLTFTDGLVRLFGDTRAPVKALRNAGMLAFDLLPGVRRAFARHTMGLAGRLPRLSRGVPLK